MVSRGWKKMFLQGGQNTFQAREFAKKENVLEARNPSLKMQVRILVIDQKGALQ
jgi:hypothetical protein